MAWRRLLVLLCGIAAVGVLNAGIQRADAQIQQAGVVVDADGVLRTQIFHDPTGALSRKMRDEARAKLNPDVMRVSELRKVSLNRLEDAIAACIATGKPITDEMKYLAGLTAIDYVFYYPETQDIVIAGPAEGYLEDLSRRPVGIHSGKAVLELQDLVVALRAFPPTGEAAKVIGVSIDPTAEGLAQMQQFISAIRGRVVPADAPRIAAGLKENLGLQNVSIQGISPKSHFAQVLVEADYRMKLIGIGLEVPPVKIPSYVSRAKSGDIARNALQRWYFTPNYESVRVSEDNLAMQLIGDGVKLVGAQEMVTMTGGRVDSANRDQASDTFTTAFTEKYDELAAKSPVYAQLRNLIDMSIVAAFIQKQGFYVDANWDLGVLGNEDQFAVETYNAPQQVETAVNAVWKGNRLLTPVGGGVNIQPRMALVSRHVQPDTGGEVRDARQQIDIKALPKTNWWWD